ncbi:predicted protein [Histoplasma capsulatum G186AR]|uniref:Uncharacterized protein n=1 Tax=Ajellomyces capsulatus (strain G186AR / H82 / ATCC MYA-2454 / RMSCC 2432) TaxID=447093 RepID=C0NDK6_AJECG|nr:uncharacterized protein HCBG_01949 [Histoplasma capsulatum G186AR]EEH10304.1 predicted protein [Histoplasma capsulatum G186AR]
MFKQPPTVMKKNPSIQALNVLAAKLFVCVSNGCTNLRIRRIFGAFLFDCNSLFGITGFGSMARGVNMPLRQIWIELSADCLVLLCLTQVPYDKLPGRMKKPRKIHMGRVRQ